MGLEEYEFKEKPAKESKKNPAKDARSEDLSGYIFSSDGVSVGVARQEKTVSAEKESESSPEALESSEAENAASGAEEKTAEEEKPKEPGEPKKPGKPKKPEKPKKPGEPEKSEKPEKPGKFNKPERIKRSKKKTSDGLSVKNESGEDNQTYAHTGKVADDSTGKVAVVRNGKIISEEFAGSVVKLTADEIAPPPEKKQPSTDRKIKEAIRHAVMAVCAVVFVCSAVVSVRNFVDYWRGERLYGEVADNIFNGLLGADHGVMLSDALRSEAPLPTFYQRLELDFSNADSDIAEPEYNQKFQQMKQNLNYLKSLNPDIYGYIYIDGTRISFPIVQGRDNNYYLTHAYTGEYMIVGSIFADFNIDRNIENNRNTVLYGHNMKDGNMFNNVSKFVEDEELFNNALIEVYTFDGIYTFEPFAVYETVSYDKYFKTYFESDEEFLKFFRTVRSKSVFSKDMEFDAAEDRILTLSTCTNESYNGRYALHAKLVKIEK